MKRFAHPGAAIAERMANRFVGKPGRDDHSNKHEALDLGCVLLP
jgi:hypothetical protein